MPYFDHNATAPLEPAAREAWLVAQRQDWQNPGGAYRSAARVQALIDRQREQLGGLLGAAPGRLVFTSGATEAANTALAHLARAYPAGRLLLARTEHSCVRAAAARHFGERLEWLAQDAAGVVDLAALARRLASRGIAAVAVMAANNETGVLQPWREIAAACREAGVPYLCDAVQWLGKLSASGLGAADFLFASAHKFGGPKGIGFLITPEAVAPRDLALLVGGGQQDGRRAGTEDWPSIAALGAALLEAERKACAHARTASGLRDRFEAGLLEAIPGAQVVGRGVGRLWNTSMAILPAGEGARWVLKLDKRGFEVTTAAACSAAQGRSSAVLEALGVPAVDARRALRFSSGWETTPADWAALLGALAQVRTEIGAGVHGGGG
ncbi:MAG: aminotransferase class V-fold PLP-dependent enzyme [Opitutaceae bacterium]